MVQITGTALPWHEQLRRATGRGFAQEVLTHGLQTGGVHKTGDLNLSQGNLTATVGQFGGHGTVLTDGERGQTFGQGDRRIEQRAVGGDHLSGGRHLETAVAGVGNGAVGLGDLEEAVTPNGQIQRVAGGHHVALHVGFFGRDHARTGTEHQASGRLGVSAGLAAGLANALVEQIFEHRAVALEARRVDVGQVVRNDRHALLLRVQAGFGNPQ